MTTREILEAARRADCACGATPGQPCACETAHYHLARIARACQHGLITPGDLASVIWGDLFYGMDTIGEVTA